MTGATTTLELWFDRTRRMWWAIPLMLMMGMSAGCAWLTTPMISAQDAESEFIWDGQFEPVYLEARLRMTEKDNDGALALLKPHLDQPGCPVEFFTSIAEIHQATGKNDEALVVLDRAAVMFPNAVTVFEDRASLHRRLGQAEKSIADLDRALELEPINPQLLEEVGLLRLRNLKSWVYDGTKESEVGQLLDIYERLLAVRAGSERIVPILVLTSLYNRIGQNDKAIEMAKEAVHVKPQDIRGHLSLAETYESAGKFEEALTSYEQAILIEPLNEQIQAKVAALVQKTGRAGGTAAFYEALSTQFPGVLEVQALYGQELLNAKSWDKGAVHFAAVLQKWPDNRKFKSALVRCLFALDRDSEALEIARGLISDPHSTDRDMLELATLLRGAGELDSVLELMQQIADTHPDEFRLRLQLAGVQLQLGKIPEATASLEKLVETRPDVFPAVAMLGALYSDSGELDKAQELYKRVEGSMPPDRMTDLQVLRAQVSRDQGNEEEAIAILNSILEKGGEIPELATQMLVEIYAGRQEFEAAHTAVDKYIAGAGGDEQAFQGRKLKAWIYWRVGDFNSAITLLEEMHAKQPEAFEVVRMLVENYSDAKRYDEAEGLVTATEKLVDKQLEPELKLMRAKIQKDRGNMDAAILEIEGLLTGTAADERYLMIISEYYHQAGRIEDAERVLRKTIEINPDNAEAYNALGYFFAEAGIKLDEAEVLVNKALEMNPGAPHIMDSLGWVYYKRGDYEKAVKVLAETVEKMKGDPDPVVLDHYGDALMKVGDQENARKTWMRALELDPDLKGLKDKLADPKDSAQVP